jgi:hypothetical protein
MIFDRFFKGASNTMSASRSTAMDRGMRSGLSPFPEMLELQRSLDRIFGGLGEQRTAAAAAVVVSYVSASSRSVAMSASMSM